MNKIENGAPDTHPQESNETTVVYKYMEIEKKNTGESSTSKKTVRQLPRPKIAPVPANEMCANSQGEILDREFMRLVEKEKLEIQEALLEVHRLNDYAKYWNTPKIKPFNLSDRAIANAYNRCFEKQRQKAFAHLKISTMYDGKTTLEEAVKELSALLKPVLINDKPADIIAKGILHWMWQVKRRVFGMSVKNHIAIGFINEGLGEDGQGSGKTTFVQNLCRPLTVKPHEEFLYIDTTLAELIDSRGWQGVLSLLVAFLDDVTCENKFDVGIFKSIISCEGNKGARRMKTHIIDRVKVLLSVIFTANTSNFGEVIKDKSGNRRFLPIMVKDFKGIIPEDFDSLPFWQMVNHEWDCFVNQAMFRQIQKEHLTKSSLELLLEMYDVQPSNEPAFRREIMAKDIKIALNKHFPAEKGFSTTQSVTKEMAKLGYKAIENGGTARNQKAYYIRFFGNSFERWQANFQTVQTNITNPMETLIADIRKASPLLEISQDLDVTNDESALFIHRDPKSDELMLETTRTQ